ncbi:ThiF family adenylyltransferase [Actinokineospora sp. NPDC004072]
MINADTVRQLLTEIDLVLCATDGVAPRRVISHLARRAGKPAVLACVLADGAYGDIVRLRPWPDHGCLSCRTDALTDSGGLRPDLQASTGYEGGNNPMSAVGADLHLVGQLAAKVAVATLLHGRGHHDQWTAGEHAVIALRPRPGWAAPYDLRRAGEVAWWPAAAPRSGCPTCAGISRPGV